MKYPAVFACLACVACDLAPSPPIVASFNGSSVTIAQTNMVGEGARGPVTDAEATRICTKAGKKTAEYASSRLPPNATQIEHLYLCL